MTIDEAIKHAEEVAEANERLCETIHPSLQWSDYGKCAVEHRQLAEWLKDYKRLKEQEPILDKIKAEIEMYEADCRLQGGTDECEKCNSNVFGSVYRIIDKYKAESEE